jgi:hypothetical protein
MRALLCAVAVGLVSTTGCVWATKAQGPDGKEAFRVHCSTPAQCAEKAAEVCAGDYHVISSSTTMDGYANNGTGYANSPHETLVACGNAPSVASASPVVATPAAPASAKSPEPMKESGTCATAYGSVKETFAFWGQLSPEAKLLPESPSQRDFVEVCRALPERVQRCLDARYREAHDKPCMAVLKRLEAGEKNKVDSLFLE